MTGELTGRQVVACLVALGASLLAILGFAVWLDRPVVPVCLEDEVVTVSGACAPADDADYVGGVGWVAP